MTEKDSHRCGTFFRNRRRPAGCEFRGTVETYPNVIGEDELVERIKECYSSLFTDRAIDYRVQKGLAHLDVAF